MKVKGIDRELVLEAMIDDATRKAEGKGLEDWTLDMGGGQKLEFASGKASLNGELVAQYEQSGEWSSGLSCDIAAELDGQLGEDFLPSSEDGAGLSLDNGNTYWGPSELMENKEEIDELHRQIVNRMDDGTRERLHHLLAPCDELTFIAAYIAIRELVVG